jgi:hypothetical protein
MSGDHHRRKGNRVEREIVSRHKALGMNSGTARDFDMSAMISVSELIPISIIADRLHYMGRDRERSVRRLFERHRVSIIKRSRGAYFVTEAKYAELIEKMTTCSPSGNAANTSTSAARSVSGGKRASSKSILREEIAARMQRNTVPSSKPMSGTKCFTVVEGGRTP